MKKELRFEFTADTSDFTAKITKAGADVQKYARDTGKELDKARVLKLEVDLSSLKVAKKEASDELKSLQRQYKEWLISKSTIVEAQRSFDRLSSSVTEAGRKLQNLRNTGDENLSRLQKKFDDVNGSSKLMLNWIKTLWRAIVWAFSIEKTADLSNIFTSMQNALKQVSSW